MGNKRKKGKNDSQNSDISGNNSKVYVRNVSSSQTGHVNNEVMASGSGNKNIPQQSVTHSTPIVQYSQPMQPMQPAMASLNGSYQLPMMKYNTSPICGYPPPMSQVGENCQNQFETLDYSSKIDQIAAKLDLVCGKLTKLDDIESRMTSFESSIGTVLQEVNKLKSQTSEMDKGLEVMNSLFEENKKEFCDMKKVVNNLVKENSSLKDDVSFVASDLHDLRERHIELQSRTMRDNLIFTGIHEDDSEDTEDTEQVLSNFIKTNLEINTESISFERVHRMGKKLRGKSRPIIAKFSKFKDRELVRKQAPIVLKRSENRNFGVNEQYPKEINDRRKELYPHLKSARRSGRKASLIYDKLYIDGKLFNPEEKTREYRSPSQRGLSADADEFTPRYGSQDFGKAKGSNSKVSNARR